MGTGRSLNGGRRLSLALWGLNIVLLLLFPRPGWSQGGAVQQELGPSLADVKSTSSDLQGTSEPTGATPDKFTTVVGDLPESPDVAPRETRPPPTSSPALPYPTSVNGATILFTAIFTNAKFASVQDFSDAEQAAYQQQLASFVDEDHANSVTVVILGVLPTSSSIQVATRIDVESYPVVTRDYIINTLRINANLLLPAGFWGPVTATAIELRVPSTTYEWRVGEYSECSVICGEGVQLRLVECIDTNSMVVEVERCEAPAPAATRPCNTQPCVTLAPPNFTVVYRDWGPCNATCGSGTRTRVANCISVEGYQANMDLCNITATELAAQLVSPCEGLPPCAGLYWSFSSWLCDNPLGCGGGRATRNAVCMDNVTGGSVEYQENLAPWAYCNVSELMLTPMVMPCAEIPCEITYWRVREPGDCSPQDPSNICGKWVVSRVVECINKVSNETTHPSKCPGEAPKLSLVECEPDLRTLPATTAMARSLCREMASSAMDLAALSGLDICVSPAAISVDGECCRSGRLDVNGRCCNSTVDACGICNGTAIGVDSLNRCCMGALDAQGICCDTQVDECGVCGGTSSCGLSGTLTLITPQALAVSLQEGRKPWLQVQGLMVALLSRTFGNYNQTYIEVKLPEDQGLVPRRKLPELMYITRRLLVDFNLELAFKISPDPSQPLPLQAQAIVMLGTMEGSILTDNVTVFGTLGPLKTVSRSGVCGDGICQVDERPKAGSPGCPQDCRYPLLACPPYNGTPCSGRGVCYNTLGVCQCFSGYTGEDCSITGSGYVAVRGFPVLRSSMPISPSPPPLVMSTPASTAPPPFSSGLPDPKKLVLPVALASVTVVIVAGLILWVHQRRKMKLRAQVYLEAWSQAETE